MMYWGVVVSAVGVLLAAGAAPVKAGVLLAGACMAARWGPGLLAPIMGLAFLAPEAGGARPAAVPFIALLLGPLVLRSITAPAAKGLHQYPPVRALAALVVAGVVAALVGLVLRDASPSAVVFEVLQRHFPMLAFVVGLLAVPGAAGQRSTMLVAVSRPGESVLHWIRLGAGIAASVGLAQIVFGESAVEAVNQVSAWVGYQFPTSADVTQNVWWGVRKAFAMFSSPNGLAAGLVFALLLMAAGLPGERDVRQRWWTVATSGLCYVALVLTFSRAAMLACGVMCLWLAWTFRGRRQRYAAACTLAALLLPVLYLVMTNPGAQAVGTGAGASAVARTIKQETAMMKVTEVRQTFQMFRDGHWLGAGHGVLYEPGPGFVARERTIGLSPAYGELVYRSGLIGVAALGLVVWTFTRRFARTSTASEHGSEHRVEPLRVAVAGALVLSCIDHPFLTVPGLAVTFWGSLGLLARTDWMRWSAR